MNNIDELVNKLILKIKEDIVEGNPTRFIKTIIMNVDIIYIQKYLTEKDNEKV